MIQLQHQTIIAFAREKDFIERAEVGFVPRAFDALLVLAGQQAGSFQTEQRHLRGATKNLHV